LKQSKRSAHRSSVVGAQTTCRHKLFSRELTRHSIGLEGECGSEDGHQRAQRDQRSVIAGVVATALRASALLGAARRCWRRACHGLGRAGRDRRKCFLCTRNVTRSHARITSRHHTDAPGGGVVGLAGAAVAWPVALTHCVRARCHHHVYAYTRSRAHLVAGDRSRLAHRVGRASHAAHAHT
jgi:hypothetical protein